MNRQPPNHIDSERLQALAEGELDGADRHEAEHHVHGCARCRAECEAWTLLFREIETLPAVHPSEEFTARVMDRIRTERSLELVARESTSLFGRMRAGIAARFSTALGSTKHISDDVLQQLVDRSSALPARLRARRHLGSCTHCRTRADEWRAMFARLDGLPRLAPSEGFAEQVLARTSIAEAPARTAATPSRLGRLRRAARSLIPSTPRGWTVAGGLVAAPSVGVLVAVAAVILHPLVTFRDLGIFLTWRASEAVAAVWSGAVELAVGTPWVGVLAQAFVELTESPGLAAAGILALWAMTLVAGTVLYRYLIAPTFTAGHHAEAS